MFKRVLNLSNLLDKKSFFLFGPRSTGKSTLIQEQLKNNAVIIDLLKTQVYLRLSTEPYGLEGLIEHELSKASPGQKKSVIVIDEIQKIPILLNEVHRLIEEKKWRFLLTGSSARKLKADGVNLLGGRAWIAELFPLCFAEIDNFSLDKVLRYGSLPHVYSSDFPEEELQAYVQTYLKEEIQAEALVRKIPAFVDFLRIAAQSSGQLTNYNALSQKLGVSQPTVTSYYQILQDTFLGFLLEPWQESKKRKPIQTAKFYFFDAGVWHTLLETESLDRNSSLYGDAFESLIIRELRCYLSYRRKKMKLQFWRTENGDEVDAVVGQKAAIEIKSTRRLSQENFKGLLKIQEEKAFEHYYLVSQDPVESLKQGVTCIHWQTFLQQLWSDNLF